MKLTYEELEARCDRLEKLLKKALDRITDLEEKLNQNSHNSSKPPSSDRKSNTRYHNNRDRKPRQGTSRILLPCRSRVDDLFMDALVEGSADLEKLCEKLLLDKAATFVLPP